MPKRATSMLMMMTTIPTKSTIASLLIVSVLSALLNTLETASASSVEGKNGGIQIIPRIVSTPAAVTYFDESQPELSLTCEVWPPTANVSFFVDASNRQPLSLRPITSNNSKDFSFSRRVITSMNSSTDSRVPALSNAAVTLSLRGGEGLEHSNFWQLQSVNVHCGATTKSGSVLSAPFHIQQTRLVEYLDPPDLRKPRIEKFLHGNLAFVSCPIPPDSQPMPIVRFHINGTLIIDNNQKYKQIRRPNEENILLLINNFEASDVGDYRCELINPVTGKALWSPEIVRLQLKVPDNPVIIRPLLTLAPQGNGSATASRQITVREGDNVTLVCILEGVPPPKVRTYSFKSQNYPGTDSRDQNFAGLLQLVNVGPSDGGIYLCSMEHLSFTATLVVKPRLRLAQTPHDVHLQHLNLRAEFLCSASDPTVTPFWLFNGKPISSLNPQQLIIASVKKSDLGFYQCVARTLMPDGRIDEWVSATAHLSLQSDKLVKTAADLMEFVTETRNNQSDAKALPITQEMTPQVEMALDNLAVYLVWNFSDATLQHGKHVAPNLSSSQLLQKQQIAYQIEYAVLIKESFVNPALAGLIAPASAVWSKTETLKTMWKYQYIFIIGHPLEPGKTFRFRVRAVSVETGVDVISPSDWSEPVSTHHISTAAPPKITSIQPYHDGRFSVAWEYDSDAQTFKPDFFLILVRPVLRSAPLSTTDDTGPSTETMKENAVVRFGRYRATQVNGSDSREAFVHNLNSSISYQLVVYGVKYEQEIRRITRFSEAKFATLPKISGYGTFSLIQVVIENKLYFIGFGTLALIIYFVLLLLVITCIARQNKRRIVRNSLPTSKKNNLHQPSQRLDEQSLSLKAVHSKPEDHDQVILGDTLMCQTNPSQLQQSTCMGSGMHLGYYGSQHPQQHHQSHHSLLIPATTGPGMIGSPTIQGGTLPLGGRNGGMMYPFSQPTPMQMIGVEGQPIVLNQMDGMEQASLIRDYSQHQHQQQQRHLYHQHLLNQQQQNQATSLMQYAQSPQQQHMMNTLTLLQHNQDSACGGSIHSAASLTHEPSGSLRDEARSLTTPHSPPTLADQILPPSYFQTPIYYQQQQHPSLLPPAQRSGTAYYPGQLQADSAHSILHNMGPSYANSDASYSYFAPQTACPSQSHAFLNPLSEESQMNLAYAESGCQTGRSNKINGPVSPSPGEAFGEHRHHHRRRRKQQPPLGAEHFGGGENYIFNRPIKDGEHEAMMPMVEAQNHATSNEMNAPPLLSSEDLRQEEEGKVVNHSDNLHTGNWSFDKHSPPYGAPAEFCTRSFFPPPCQPPPPPPPAMMMMMQITSSGGLENPGMVTANPDTVICGSLNNSNVLNGVSPMAGDYLESGLPTATPNADGFGSQLEHGVVP